MPDESTISIDLESLQDIMDMLPETPTSGEKRRNALTRDDVLVIAKVVAAMTHNSCAMGFTPEEIGEVKGVIKAVNTGILGIGWLIVSSIVVAVISGIGWAVKHGIADIAAKGAK